MIKIVSGICVAVFSIAFVALAIWAWENGLGTKTRQYFTQPTIKDVSHQVGMVTDVDISEVECIRYAKNLMKTKGYSRVEIDKIYVFGWRKGFRGGVESAIIMCKRVLTSAKPIDMVITTHRMLEPEGNGNLIDELKRNIENDMKRLNPIFEKGSLTYPSLQ